MRHHLLGEILDRVQRFVRIAAEIHIENDPADAELVIDGQLVYHLLLHADQQAARHLIDRLAARQNTDHAVIDNSRAAMDIVEPAKERLRHLDPLALFHLAVAHETDPKKRQLNILAGLAGLFLAAVEGFDLFAKEALPSGKGCGLYVIALPCAMVDRLRLDGRHHHRRSARVHRARHHGDGIELVIGSVPGHLFLAKKGLQHLERFIEPRTRLFHRDAEAFDLIGEIAPPDTKQEPALGEDIGNHHLTGKNPHVAYRKD